MYENSLSYKIFTSVLLLTISVLPAVSQERYDSVSKTLQGVVVTDRREFLRDTKMGYHSMTGDDIIRMPVIFGEPDVIKALQALPGVTAGMEGFSGLYVRGGGNDQNLFLLDRLPLHNVSHLGGVFSSFNAYSIQKADFYKSAFPSYIGGKISSVTDMQLRPPDFYKTRGTFTIGLVSGSAFVTTPIVKGSTAISVALRRTWLDVVTVPALAILNASKKSKGEESIGGYAFTDVSVRLDHIWKPGLVSSLKGFFSHDSFKMGERRFETDRKEDSSAEGGALYDKKDVTSLKWTTYGVLANLTSDSGNGAFSFDLYWTGADSRQREALDYVNGTDEEHSRTSALNSINELGMSESYRFNRNGNIRFNIGMQQIWRRYNPDRREMVNIDGGEAALMSASKPSRVDAGELAAYGEMAWKPPMPFSFTAGLRWQACLACGRKELSWEPRLSLQVSLSESASLKLGYSRMSQFMQQVSSNYISLPTDSWLPTGAVHTPLASDIFSVGAYALTGKGMKISAEGWYKDMSGIAEFQEGVSLANPDVPWQEKVTFGRGWAYGCDLTMEKGFGKVSVALSYGLLWNWRKFPDLNGGERFPAKFDNRHKVDLSAHWQIRHNITFNAQWQYMTGNRTTLALYNIDLPNQFFPAAPMPLPDRTGIGDHLGADYYTGRNNVRLPAFHRLNLSLTRRGKLRKKLDYEWNFGLYNAYWHRNAFAVKKDFVLYGKWNRLGWNRNFKVLSLIPILPSVSYTIKF